MRRSTVESDLNSSLTKATFKRKKSGNLGEVSPAPHQDQTSESGGGYGYTLASDQKEIGIRYPPSLSCSKGGERYPLNKSLSS